MICFCTLHDVEGRMADLTDSRLSQIMPLFEKVVVAITDQSHKRLKPILVKHGVVVVRGGGFGAGKVAALNEALRYPSNEMLYLDFDKLLNWQASFPGELKTLSRSRPDGFVVLGRTPKAWNTYPDSWKLTENIVNRLANQVFGKENWDWFTSDFMFTNPVGQKIAQSGLVEGAGIIFNWPRVAQENGFQLSYLACDGLGWEDPDRFAPEIKKMGFDKWKRDYYDGKSEWKKRIKNLNEATVYLLEEMEPTRT